MQGPYRIIVAIDVQAADPMAAYAEVVRILSKHPEIDWESEEIYDGDGNVLDAFATRHEFYLRRSALQGAKQP